MKPDDDTAIAMAAELRRHNLRQRRELDARIAEVPRTIATAGPEFAAELRRMARYLVRAAVRWAKRGMR